MRTAQCLLQAAGFSLAVLSFSADSFGTNPEILLSGLEPYFQAAEKSTGNKDYCGNGSVDATARTFLYRRFAQVAYGRDSETQEALIKKYSTLAYLICRESSGRVVAHVGHEHESESSAARYGKTFSDMMNAINRLANKRTAEKCRSYFDTSTNAGLFQVSADWISTRENDMRASIRKAFRDKVAEIDAYDNNSLLSFCGTKEFFNDHGITNRVRETVSWMTKWVEYQESINAKSIFSDDYNRMEELAVYHQLQTICPGLNLYIAKILLYKAGSIYFGPLRNKKNFESCGTSYAICRPNLRAITQYLNSPMYSEHIHSVMTGR